MVWVLGFEPSRESNPGGTVTAERVLHSSLLVEFGGELETVCEVSDCG